MAKPVSVSEPDGALMGKWLCMGGEGGRERRREGDETTNERTKVLIISRSSLGPLFQISDEIYPFLKIISRTPQTGRGCNRIIIVNKIPRQ